MEVIEKIKLVVDTLNELDNYNNGLNEELSKVDCKIQDLLHYLENNKINIIWCYRYVKELKKIRIERRIIKNDMELLLKYNEIKNKLVSVEENRNFLMNEIYKRNKTLNIPYKNRQYSEDEMTGILKGEKTNG